MKTTRKQVESLVESINEALNEEYFLEVMNYEAYGACRYRLSHLVSDSMPLCTWDRMTCVEMFQYLRGVRAMTWLNDRKKPYLYVTREDDDKTDYKRGFASFTEANHYRQKCQARWINFCDYVFLWTGTKSINLTRCTENERNLILQAFDIPK